MQLALPGLYNVYNALAAAALAIRARAGARRRSSPVCKTRRLPSDARRASCVGAPAHPRELRILLVKNPAGANEVLRTLALEPGLHDVLGVLNDNIADGRDVSWVWDADFELLAGPRAPRHLRRHTRRGAGGTPEVRRRRPRAVSACARVSPPRSTRPSPTVRQAAEGDRPLYALPTYTAMLSLRELLVARGEAPSAWS